MLWDAVLLISYISLNFLAVGAIWALVAIFTFRGAERVSRNNSIYGGRIAFARYVQEAPSAVVCADAVGGISN